MIERLWQWWCAPAPARRLAMLRILVGAYAVAYLLVRFAHLIGVSQMTLTQWKPVGPVSLLAAPLSPVLVTVLVVAAVVAGVGFVAGTRYRIVGPLFAVLFLWVTSYRNSWSMVFHTENLLVMHVLVLSVAPAADALSLDARRRKAAVDDTPHAWYGWAIRLMCAVTVVTYFIAGWSKLQNAGFAWVTSDTLRVYVAYDNLRKVELGAGYSMLGAALAKHAWLFPPMAAVSLAVELGAPAALLHRRLGQLWSAVAWSFHLGVLILMAIMFHYPITGVGYASFFRVEKLADRWQAWRQRRASA